MCVGVCGVQSSQDDPAIQKSSKHDDEESRHTRAKMCVKKCNLRWHLEVAVLSVDLRQFQTDGPATQN